MPLNVRIWRKFPPLMFFVGLFLLAGCSTPSNRSETAETAEANETRKADQTLVVGRLSVVQDQEEIRWGAFQAAQLAVARKGSTDTVVHELTRADGMFFWELQPGDYVIAALGYAKRDGWTGSITKQAFRIWAEFKVPEAGATYIGTLKVVVPGAISIDDENAVALQAFREKYPGQQNPQTKLMHVQDSVGQYESMQYICSPVWGIDCTKTYQGITPLEPNVKPDAYPEVESLTPTFRWQDSSLEDVTYDIVIYEDIAYRYNFLTTHLPGQIIFYKEGLTNPEYRLSEKLKPGTKYYWSVRLRRNNVVSNWSQFSFFKFMVFAAKSGQTPWFGFSTPLVD